MAKKFSYHKSVNYSLADPMKVLAQKEGRATAKNLPFGFKEVESTRGESAYVFDMGEQYGALISEGLGTKSLVAQAVYQQIGKSFFGAVAQDSVAAIINDLISVGATPVALSAYWSSSSYDWLGDQVLAKEFISGWRKACDKAGVAWGGGETQSLPNVIEKGALELAGSAFGVIKPKNQLLSEKNLKAGDAILLIESNGVHANGISLIRKIAATLQDSYQTKLSNGRTLGEEVLKPTHIYAPVVRKFFDSGLDVHYLSNITGHGWRKIMRPTRTFTYNLENIPPVEPIFDFIQEHSNNDNEEMYSNYNMGAGYAIYLPLKDAKKAQGIAENLGFRSWLAGKVEEGPKQVVIKPKNITFAADSLEVR
ncbi:phosphoribosylformylglycinamidine cyclo-ligase [Candidatus Saccharibacteria bacterium]|nr:phosphoribosylformylglycinamidine cyclo-ligase [Candidatus Saccharibacteria bacterium]